jgi:hypothetical protein
MFIEKDRTNIPERTSTFILKEFKFEVGKEVSNNSLI